MKTLFHLSISVSRYAKLRGHYRAIGFDISIILFKYVLTYEYQSKPKLMNNLKNFNREDFMNFFRNNEKLNELTVDDRVEIFSTILAGNSDLNKKLLDEILSDYNVNNLEIVEK